MATEFNPGSAGSLDEAVKMRYEANANTNAFTDTEKTKLAGIAAGAQVNPGDATTSNSGLMSASDKTKLTGIEAGAQVNPSAATTSVAGLMSAADKTKLNSIAAGAEVNPANATTSAAGLMSASDKTKLDGVAASANNYTHPNHSGDVTSVNDGATTITNNAVSMAKLADIGTETVIGRVAASTGDPKALTKAELTTLVDTFTSAAKGVVPPSGGGTTNFLRADGTWQAPAGGSGGIDWTTAVNADIIPDTNNTRDLGSSTTKFAEGHFTALYMNGANVLTDSVSALTQKTTPVDADKVPIFDSAASDATKYATRGSIVAGKADTLVTVNAQTGTSYTLVIGDASKVITMNNAASNTLVVPANSSVAFSIGTVIVIQQIGAGATTIDGATGVTINGVSGGNGLISARWGGVSILKTATDTWLAMGNVGTFA